MPTTTAMKRGERVMEINGGNVVYEILGKHGDFIVLTPGGRFYFEEVTAHALNRLTYRRLFDHPTDDRFTADQVLQELRRHGLVILGSVTRIQGDYLLGVAAKPHPAAGAR